MTDPTPTADPAEFPDMIIRHGFPADDRKVIEGNWTAWPEETRRKFLDLLAGTRPSDLPDAVAGFLQSNRDEPERQQPDQAQDDGTGGAVDPAVAARQAERAQTMPPQGDGPADPIPPTIPTQRTTSTEEPADLTDQAPEPPTPPGPGALPSGAEEHELHGALETVATAKAWAEAHPEDVPALLAHEEGERGRGRKTLLDHLRELAAAQEPGE
jgi:hypothetical protein